MFIGKGRRGNGGKRESTRKIMECSQTDLDFEAQLYHLTSCATLGQTLDLSELPCVYANES